MDKSVKKIVEELSKIIEKQLEYKQSVMTNSSSADLVKINDYFAANLEYNKLQAKLMAGLIDIVLDNKKAN